VKRLGILISGRGSNLEAIADHIDNGRLDAEIAVVISSRPDARGLEAARARGLPTASIPSKGMDREAYDQLLLQELQSRRVDFVCLAGFMRLLSAAFIRQFANRILNIHPSLLPAFPGLDAQHQALAYGVKITGCTADCDSGGGAGAGRGRRGNALGADLEGRAPDLRGGAADCAEWTLPH
jgi:phosphoribosylglycinamide formyltransferase-1